jgi:hypothetical protein
MNTPNIANATPTTAIEPSNGFISFVLNHLNVARLQALCAANEIATTAAALSGGLISAEAAVLHSNHQSMSQELERRFDELVERSSNGMKLC